MDVKQYRNSPRCKHGMVISTCSLCLGMKQEGGQGVERIGLS